jgi:hypothetical protein
MNTELFIATWIVRTAGVYFTLGIIFAVYFVIWGVGRIDPNAQHGTRGFRILILPGAAAFWPILLRRLITRASDPPIETNAHRALAEKISKT